MDRTSVAFTGTRIRGGEVGGLWAGAGQLDFAGPPADVAWMDVWGLNSSAWVAVGQSTGGGIAYHEIDKTVRVLPEVLTHVAGFGPDDIYGVGASSSIYHFDGQSWTLVPGSPGDIFGGLSPMQTVGTSDLYVLQHFWNVPGELVGFQVSRFDGSDWSINSVPHYDDPSDASFLAMWVFSPDDIWIFGRGLMWHFDGSTWLPTDAYSLSQMGSLGDWEFASAWGSAPDDLYALAWPRTVWHYDGTSWTITRVGLEQSAFYWIGGNAGDDVFVLGQFGEVAHFDGRTWEPNGSARPQERG